jgi:ribonuclease-3
MTLDVTPDTGPLYSLALTHRSYAFENDTNEHNERLEFLGDAILGAVVTDLIYNRYPDLNEGEMARLRASVVNPTALAELSSELGLGERILLGKGEEQSGGRGKASLLANAFEAVVGAIFLDRGLDAVADELTPVFTGRLEGSMQARNRYDAKTALQEIAVRDTGELPSYRVASSGPDHDKRFVAHVYMKDELFGTGAGRSKKEAEQRAATEALDRLALEHDGGHGDARAS